jgi:ribosomal protein S16
MRLVQALERLGTAREFVRQGERDIHIQRALLKRLQRQGRDVSDQVRLLAQMEEMQTHYVDHYDRVGDQVLGLVRPEEDE